VDFDPHPAPPCGGPGGRTTPDPGVVGDMEEGGGGAARGDVESAAGRGTSYEY